MIAFQVLGGLRGERIPVQAVVRTIMKKPGLKDNNFQASLDYLYTGTS